MGVATHFPGRRATDTGCDIEFAPASYSDLNEVGRVPKRPSYRQENAGTDRESLRTFWNSEQSKGGANLAKEDSSRRSESERLFGEAMKLKLRLNREWLKKNGLLLNGPGYSRANSVTEEDPDMDSGQEKLWEAYRGTSFGAPPRGAQLFRTVFDIDRIIGRGAG